MALLFTLPRVSVIDLAGTVAGSSRLYFYQTGTSTPQAVYADAALTQPLTQPVTASDAGTFPAVYLDDSLPNYKVVCKDANDAELWTVDPYLTALDAGQIGQAINPPSAAEDEAAVEPTDLSYPTGAALGYTVLRVNADNSGQTSSDNAIADAINVAKRMGVQLSGGSTGRDQGVDVYLPAGLYVVDNPIVLPRSGNSRNWCVGIIGDGEATRIQPSATFPANRAVIEWEATTFRVFHQRLRDFKIDMRDGLAHKAIWFKLNDPTTKVFNGQQWAQEEIKELDIDVMIHGNNTDHAVLVDIEGKAKFSRFRIYADLAIGTAQTYSTILLQANSQYIDTSGNAGDKNDAIVDNSGINYSSVEVFAVNSRGGRAQAFKGRLHNCRIHLMGSATGGYGAAPVIELYGSTANVFDTVFGEGRQEDPQVYLEECHYNQFLLCVIGTPDAPGPGTAFELVGCEDNIFWNHPSGDSKPSYASQSGFLVKLDANSSRNRFTNFDSNGAFNTEVQDLGTNNYFEFKRASTGLITNSHRVIDYSIGPWSQDNVTDSQTDVELTGTRWIAPRAGRLTAISLKSTEARTAGTLTVKVFKNLAASLFGATGSEVSSSFRAQLDGTDTKYKLTLAANDYNFAAGDEIYAVVETGATWTPTTADIRVWVEVQC